MRAARIEQARTKAGPLTECVLALLGHRDPDDEQTTIDAEAGAFVLAETVQWWRRSMRR